MAVVDKKRVIEHIAGWVSGYCAKYSIQNTFAEFDASPQACVVAEILQRSHSFFRPLVFGERPEIKHLYRQFFEDGPNPTYLPLSNIKYKEFEIKEFADHESGITLGLLTKDCISLDRQFKKSRQDCHDLYPIADLYMSEVYEIYNFITNSDKTVSSRQSITEWALREDLRNGVITGPTPLQKHKSWFTFTITQKEELVRLYNREAKTNHKEFHAPICLVRSEKNLVI